MIPSAVRWPRGGCGVSQPHAQVARRRAGQLLLGQGLRVHRGIRRSAHGRQPGAAVARGARHAAVIALALALLADCDGVGGVYVPPLLPIAITVAQDGSVEVSFDPELATPIGTFSLNVPVAHFRVPPGDTVLIILFAVAAASLAEHGGNGAQVELTRDLAHDGPDAYGAQTVQLRQVIEINKQVPMRFVYSGRQPGLTHQGNAVTLTLYGGANLITIEDATKLHTGRFTLEHQAHPPKPTGITVPATPASWPVPGVSCPSTGTAGAVVTCNITRLPADSSHYQWFADGAPIGRDSSQLSATLRGGAAYFITVTVTTASGLSFSSAGTEIKVPAAAAGASRGPLVPSDALT